MMAAIGLQVLLFEMNIAAVRAEEGKAETPKAAAPAAKGIPSQDELDKMFTEKMSGVVFAGHYSVTSNGDEKPPQMEKYTISKVVKMKDDYWLFTARVQYGKNDVTVPMVLLVKWAGDTPVISLTDLTIPGLGTFTSRVVLYGDLYAGTWQHGAAGGHLWGRLEKVKADRAAPKSDDKASNPDK